MSQDTRYITEKECSENTTKIKQDLDIIKRALCGEDMRGGLIYDVNQLFGKISNFTECVNEMKCELAEEKENRKESRKMILGIITSLAIAAISAAVAFLK